MPANALNANSLFFCAKKIKPARKVLDALRHNKRKIQAELGAFGHINASKTPMNYCLEGCKDPEEGYKSTLDAIAQFNSIRSTKMRRDAVIVGELVFSLPAARLSQQWLFEQPCDKSPQHLAQQAYSIQI